MILCFGTTPAISRTMRFSQLQIGEVNRARDVYTYAAGKVVNAARAIRKLGADSISMGVQGGMLGPALIELLERDRIPHRFLQTVAPTRLVITAIDEAGITATELIEDAPPMSEEEGEALLTQLGLMLARVRVAVFSGSLARGLAADYHARCIRLAHDHGVQVLLDASGEPLREAIVARPNVIKVNAHELAAASRTRRFDGEAGLLDSARSVARQIDGHVIVTRGHKATLAVEAGGRSLRIEPLRAERVISPIGSGDSFAGGVAVALSRGEPFEAMLTHGTACAMANVETPHAAHFELSAVTRWSAEVKISDIEG